MSRITILLETLDELALNFEQTRARHERLIQELKERLAEVSPRPRKRVRFPTSDMDESPQDFTSTQSNFEDFGSMPSLQPSPQSSTLDTAPPHATTHTTQSQAPNTSGYTSLRRSIAIKVVMDLVLVGISMDGGSGYCEVRGTHKK